MHEEDTGLRNQIAALGEKQQLPAREESSQVARLELPADLSFRVVPGATRSGVADDLVVPLNGAWVRLEMLLDRDDFRSYETVLQNAEGKGVRHASDLTGVSIGGNLVVLWRVPSDSIPAGDYVLWLKGKTRDGSLKEVDYYRLTISRKYLLFPPRISALIVCRRCKRCQLA